MYGSNKTTHVRCLRPAAAGDILKHDPDLSKTTGWQTLSTPLQHLVYYWFVDVLQLLFNFS
jgi:hypothetical protein